MASFTDLSESIYELNIRLKNIIKDKLVYNNDEVVIEFFNLFYKIYYSQIHEYLANKNSLDSENEIRTHIRNINSNILPFIQKKIEINSSSIELSSKYFYLYDNFYALVCFRSLEHFALYSEWGDGGTRKTHWKDTLPCFHGFWYYAGKMVLGDEIQFIEKQFPTGYGKSFSDLVMLAFIYGNNVTDDTLKIFGASENVSTFTMGLVDLMITSLYAKVFPYYRQFECDPDKMFSIRQIKDTGSKLRIVGSPKINLRVVSKDKNTNGVRAKWLFLDDITQLVDAYNLKAHERDIFKLNNEWFKRNYDLKHFKVVVGGTTYSNDDMLSYLLLKNNIEEAEIATEGNRVVNKYTKVAKSNYIIENGKSVFVCVPKLDWETDESTFPENYPTETARRNRLEAEDGGKMFEAMEQQRPMPSENTPFCYENIKTYKDLPKKENEGGERSNYCTASLDLPRTGKNNIAMPILSEYKGYDYVIDFLYDKIPLDFKFPDGSDTIDLICRYIIKHNVISLIVESNTNSNIDAQITERLKNKYNWVNTKVFVVYSTEKKEEKIYSVQGTIISSYRFPERNMFAPNSMFGKAMRDIITWDGKPNKSDDSIDAITIHCKKYHKNKPFAQVEILKRRCW